ncbi:MAG: PilZ domain-containing protein [Acidobacteria bacterium]|nr:PilZ domain-containing protein [Acidobacteriota bacterium]
MVKHGERRNYRRVRGGFNVRVKEEEDSSLQLSHGKSIDVSAGGILFRYNKPIQIDKIINVRFLRPNSFEFFEGNAKVTRCELGPSGKFYFIGIEFLELKDDDIKKLDYFLTSSSEMGNKRIKVSIEPTWNIVLNINDRIDEIVPDAKIEIIDAMRMVSTELVENAVKYGEPVPGMTGIEYELIVDEDQISIRVDNGVVTSSNVKEVEKSIEKITRAKDRFKLYTARLAELMESPKLGESQLGLYRIAYEGNCDLAFKYENNILSVMAKIKI